MVNIPMKRLARHIVLVMGDRPRPDARLHHRGLLCLQETEDVLSVFLNLFRGFIIADMPHYVR